MKEYIFGSQYYWLQALVNDEGKVLAYGVTTRDVNFNPSFKILDGLYYADKADPTNFNKAKDGSMVITLGKTKFDEIDSEPENIFFSLGAHDFYYHEEYYFGNPGKYQSYFFAANESGYLDVDYSNLPETTKDFEVKPSATSTSKFRENSIINTFYVTAPMEGYSNESIRKYFVGPDYNQVRVIPESLVTKEQGMATQKNKISKLSPEINIENVIEIFGKPLVINNEPTLSIRDDLTLDQKFEKEHPLSPTKDLTSRVCSLVTIDDLFSKITRVCIQLKWEGLFNKNK